MLISRVHQKTVLMILASFLLVDLGLSGEVDFIQDEFRTLDVLLIRIK